MIANRFTHREREVLTYISKGFTNPEIAQCLYLSVDTIKSHKKSLFQKLEARNAVVAVVKGLQTGIISLESVA